jgi:hypothetical protein
MLKGRSSVNESGGTLKKIEHAALPWRWGQGARPARRLWAPRRAAVPAATPPGREAGHGGPQAAPAAGEARGARHETPRLLTRPTAVYGAPAYS